MLHFKTRNRWCHDTDCVFQACDLQPTSTALHVHIAGHAAGTLCLLRALRAMAERTFTWRTISIREPGKTARALGTCIRDAVKSLKKPEEAMTVVGSYIRDAAQQKFALLLVGATGLAVGLMGEILVRRALRGLASPVRSPFRACARVLFSPPGWSAKGNLASG